MFGQPRCREWTPLATQQLRLRNLIQIVGYNIHGAECCSQPGSLYYTLHSTTMSAPFYTSEKLLSNHPKWREIDSELIHKMSSMNVVVRVWRHSRHQNDSHVSGDRKLPQTDTVVQTWGVNFSGLLHIGANLALDFTPKSFQTNTLVFQMIGGYFCSYESLRLEESSRMLNSEQPSGIAITGKEASPSRKIPVESRIQKAETKSVSPSKGFRNEFMESKLVSKSHSPPTGCFRQNFASLKTSSSFNVSNRQEHYTRSVPEFNRERKQSDSYSNSIYEHSPKSDTDIEIREYLGSDESSDVLRSAGSLSVSSRDLIRMDIEESETAENYDHTKSLPIPKCRYSSLNFLKSEIRPSYTAEKLQKLHLLQYSIKKRSQSVQEIKERIYKKSAMENCESLSPHYSLADNEDFSRSEKLSVSCREYSLLTGKNKHSSRNKDLGKIFSESRNDLSKMINDPDDSRQDKHQFVPTDFKTLDKDTRYNTHKVADPSKMSDRRFTIPLNKLLEFKSQPSPSQRLRHSQLTRLAELSRFKRRLLQDERDALLARLRRLRLDRGRLFEENQDNGTELMQNYHSLSKKSDQLRELKKSESALRELCSRSSALLQARRWKLVQDIQLVYPIQEEESGCLSILGIQLPACRDTTDGLRQCREADLAVALGRAGHCVALAAGLLGVPLRHPLRLMGSRTKVLDQLARLESEIPLFARNKDSMLFRYGLYLLNKNIAQLLWSSQRVMTPDPGDTLGNLRRLLTPPSGMDASRLFGSGSSMETAGNLPHPVWPLHPLWAPLLAPCTAEARGTSTHSLRTMLPRHHTGTGRPFNRFKDSVDGTSPKAAMIIRKHRYSRSVGSYIDEQSLQSLEMSPSSGIGSEPSLTILNSQMNTPKSETNNPSNSGAENMQNLLSFSESDLTKVTDIISPESCSSVIDFSSKSEGKVIFSLGDDSKMGEPTHESRTSKSPSKKCANAFVSKESDANEGLNLGSKLLKCQISSSEQNLNSMDDLEVIALKSDVDKLSKELAVLCNQRSVETDSNEDKAQCMTLNTNDSGTVKSRDFSNMSDDMKIEQGNLKLKSPSTEIGETLQCVDGSPANETDQTTEKDSERSCLDSSDNTNDDTLYAIDIEKLGYPPFCSQPCSTKCPRLIEDCPKMLHTGYDQCDNGDEIMHDVIVLPSAEAILTTSSHFTDSPSLFDNEIVKQGLELSTAVLNSLQNDDSQFKGVSNEELVKLAKEALKLDDADLSLEFQDVILNREKNLKSEEDLKTACESLNKVTDNICDMNNLKLEECLNKIKEINESCDGTACGKALSVAALPNTLKHKNYIENCEDLVKACCKSVDSIPQNSSNVVQNCKRHIQNSNSNVQNDVVVDGLKEILVNNETDSGNEYLSCSIDSSKECHESIDINCANAENDNCVNVNWETSKDDANEEFSVIGHS